MLAVMVFNALQSGTMSMGDLFRKLDSSNDGKISPKELQAGLREHLSIRLQDADINLLIAAVDTGDGDGGGKDNAINLDEFAALMDHAAGALRDAMRDNPALSPKAGDRVRKHSVVAARRDSRRRASLAGVDVDGAMAEAARQPVGFPQSTFSD